MNFTDLVKDTSVTEIKARIIAFCAMANLKVTSWPEGGTMQQIVTVIAQAIFAFAQIIARAIRGQFLELAEDPGDFDGAPPAAGWLSAKGSGDYGTDRIDNTFANGHVTITNNSGIVQTFSPETLTFQNEITSKTYRNSFDASIYTNPDGTATLGIGISNAITIPVSAEEAGTASNAAPGEVTILQEGLTDVDVTNDSPILGTDREERQAYIDRCLLAAAATSPNGPVGAYEYLALSARDDGTWGNSKTGNPLNINRAYFTKNSATGIVQGFFASPSGAADPGEFTIANNVIINNAVPDCVTYTGFNAIETTVAITYSVEATASPGVSDVIIKAAIAAELATLFKTIPINGYKVIATVGSIDKALISAVIGRAHRSITSVTLTLPAANVSLSLGHVGKLGTITGSVAFV